MVVDTVNIGIGRRCIWPYSVISLYKKRRRLPVFFIAYSRIGHAQLRCHDIKSITHDHKIKIPPKRWYFYFGGSGWIRTTSGLSQQIYSLPRLSNSGARPISQELLLSFLVRAAGIEPAFQAWKACILALELCSQRFSSPLIISYFFINASIYSATSTESIYLRETFSIFTGLYSSFETVSFSSLA